MKYIACFLLFCFSISLPVFSQTLTVQSLIGDHTVIQRDREVRLFGKAQPFAPVQVVVAKALYRARANKDGNWDVVIAPLGAGGPYEIKILSGEESLNYEDVYFGDVWLAIGEANMDYKLNQGVVNTVNDINEANYELIREYKVDTWLSGQPEEKLRGAGWNVCSPKTVGDFTAVGYFYAKKLFDEVTVPIGIVTAAVEGSSIEAWMSSEARSNLPHDRGPDIPEIADGEYSLEGFSLLNGYREKQISKASTTAFDGLSQGVTKKDYNDGDWGTIDVLNWKAKTHQVYWFRKTVEINAISGDSLRLDLGTAGSKVDVYLNNRHMGGARNRRYRKSIHKRYFIRGKNTLVMRVSNPLINPFLSHQDKPTLRSVTNQVVEDLSTGWKYSNDVEQKLPEVHQMQTIPSSLFNGMVAPLLKQQFAGIIYYQGEKNVENGEIYEGLLRSLISDYRVQARQGYFPFYYVQLANWGEYSSSAEIRNSWAYVREAQNQVLSSPKTGMAVAIDLGEAHNIHPKDKKSVGDRLALVALHDYYEKEELVSSGPTMKSIEYLGSEAIITYNHAKGLRSKDGSSLESFAIAGVDGIYYDARARIEGQQVILTASPVPVPKYVRYAWSDNPKVNLYNGANLPAVPFRTDDF